MSAFAAKRKARAVKVSHDDDVEMEIDEAPVIKPTSKGKKKGKSSRISFAAAGSDEEEVVIKKPVKSDASRRNIALNKLPMRRAEIDHDEAGGYSKEVLAELAGSMKSAPPDLDQTNEDIDIEMSLGPEELAGATIVETEREKPEETRILTEHEIRERKDRRARLAAETEQLPDVIHLSDSEGPNDGSMLSQLRTRQKDAGRLVREDEHILEGFDEFTNDGTVALGAKAERAARKKKVAEIEELIRVAEAGESSESDVERRIAFETGQARAGIGKARVEISEKDREELRRKVPGKLADVPTVDDVLGRMTGKLATMRGVLEERRRRLDELKREKGDIEVRKEQVQSELDRVGKELADTLRRVNGEEILGIEGPGRERGLESLANE